jgi:hypothetical protein
MRLLGREIDESRRPVVTAGLITAVCLAFALNVAILRAHHQTVAGLVRGLWTYGPVGLFVDPPLERVRLSDPATFHMSCGVECPTRRAY